jgi:hypothetical protein
MAQQRSVTREVPQLELRASRARQRSTREAHGRGGVDDRRAVLRGYWEPYYEELSLDPKHVRMDAAAERNAPLLNSHRSYDLSDILGVVESAKLEGRSAARDGSLRAQRGGRGRDAARPRRHAAQRLRRLPTSTS